MDGLDPLADQQAGSRHRYVLPAGADLMPEVVERLVNSWQEWRRLPFSRRRYVARTDDWLILAFFRCR